MNGFGKIKTKILKKLVESYSSDNKNDVKDIIKTLKSNKEFKELYLFYEEIENKYIEDKEIAKLYVEELNKVLKEKYNDVSEFCNKLNEKLEGVDSESNEIYETIDQLCETDSLSNIDKKVIAKRKLVEHLTTKKEISETKETIHVPNEKLLHTVLTNNFNVLYNNSLTNEQKEELKNILSLSNEDIETKTKELKESLVSKIDDLLNESVDSEMKTKLNNVKDEVNNKGASRINYFRLVELKNGLN
jgi:hypothetical protein